MGIFLEKLIPSRLLSNIQIGENLFTYQISVYQLRFFKPDDTCVWLIIIQDVRKI